MNSSLALNNEIDLETGGCLGIRKVFTRRLATATPLRSIAQPEETAGPTLCLDSEETSLVPGQAFAVD